MANENLTKAKKSKNDEFYTQYSDIEREISAYLEFDKNVFRDKTILLPCDDPEWSNFTKYFTQNFHILGLKKLISTSYAHNSKKLDTAYQPSLFEMDAEVYDESKSPTNGKIFTLSQDINKDSKINVHDLEWEYLEGDGDFRSQEIRALRDSADFIITNPPFSLFREFVAWIMEAEKKFAVIGNMNAITYKEIFPLIKNNKMWLGRGRDAGGNSMWFGLPDFVPAQKHEEIRNELRVVPVTSKWFTNIDHGRRHEPLDLMSMADNLKFNKKIKNNKHAYQKYDNYDAIEVPFTNAIPSDYDGIMGVPISFLDKYNPEQFEIVSFRKGEDGKDLVYSLNSSTAQQLNSSTAQQLNNSNHISEYSSDSVARNNELRPSHEQSYHQWQSNLQKNTYKTSMIMYGLMNNP